MTRVESFLITHSQKIKFDSHGKPMADPGHVT